MGKEPWWGPPLAVLINALSGKAFDAGREYERSLWVAKQTAAAATAEAAKGAAAALDHDDLQKELEQWRTP
jgi:hypothetical protein